MAHAASIVIICGVARIHRTITTISPARRERVVEIDKQLAAAGWSVQSQESLNLSAGPGVAVREFTLEKPHGRVDYLLFLNGQPAGVIEAKPEGTTLTEVEHQSGKYVAGLPDWMKPPVYPLPFIYESTGAETRFTNGYDPDARSRRVFTFHRPETLAEWLRQIAENPDLPTFRARLKAMPPLDERGLWGKQAEAIRNLEQSLAEDRPRSLIQMATGSGKTFTAANVCYRLIKHADAKRILFLVDRSNLGKQAKLEFDKFTIQETQRKFPAEYNVQHLTSNTIDATSRVCISTVQRIFSILKGEAELDQEIDEHSVYELPVAEPVEVSYNPALPPDTFDVIIIDECHRSIYGLWRQVLEYFDAHLIGLTATPTKQTFGFFRQNLVMEYSHDMAVTDGVNVDFTVYKIETAITKAGSTIEAGEFAGYRDRQTRKVRWDAVDEPIEYAAAQLDRAVVAEDQIRTVIQTFKDKLFTELFPGRKTVPKTLIFAKDDSHADDIVQIVREVFGKGNQFATKITYRTRDGKPEDLLQAFRNSMYPRIVVTVDMIATGTDVKPLECLVFMRSVKSRTYFEQMLGRGVRVIDDTEFQSVTDDAKTKDRFIVVDAVGVMDTPLAETVQPLERKPAQSLKDLFKQVAFGSKDPQVASSIAGRLARLDKHLTKDDRDMLAGLAGGTDLGAIAQAHSRRARSRPADRRHRGGRPAGRRSGRRRSDGDRHAHPGPGAAGHQSRPAERDPRRPQVLRADDRRGVQGPGALRRALRRGPREGIGAGHLVQGVHRGAQGRHPGPAGALQPPAQGTADLQPRSRSWPRPSSARRASGRRTCSGGRTSCWTSRKCAAQAAGCSPTSCRWCGTRCTRTTNLSRSATRLSNGSRRG